MQIFDKTFKEILSVEIISVLGGLFAGLLLAVYTDKLFIIPAFLLALPGFLEMRGNISGSFSSRLSSGLFLHLINPKKYTTKIVKSTVLASFLLAVAVSLSLGVVAFLVTYFVFNIVFFPIIYVLLIAGIISNAIEIPLTLFTTFYLYRKGHDPNNIMGPFVTTTGDIISVVSLLISLAIIIW